VAITDAGAPLAEEAQHYRFRRCFETPEDIGGRYAALSYFGLVPMALLGIDIAALLERAHQMQVSCGPFVPAATNPGLSLGTLLGMAARHGRNKVTFVLAEPIGTFGDEHPVVEENGMAIYRAGAPGNHRTVHNALKAFVDAGLETVAAPDYLAFLPYWRYTPERHEMLQNLRLALRNRCKVATTLGYGPRYLHATGQLHKGGPYTAVLLMLTADAPEDLPIPGEPFGFATLQRAQALGDFQALAAKGRRVLRIHLGQDVDHGLERLVQSLR